MNTNNLKRFAKEARIKLLDQIGRKLAFVLSADTAELRGKQREIDQLKKKIAEQGKEQVIETVAYTWFNRLMALRFMDANGYNIPKVITPLPGMTQPEVLQNALGGNVEPVLNLDRQRLNDLLDGKTAVADAQTEAYKMLLVASCNQWHTAMPFMFERISDYTELLLPDDLLSDYSIVADIRNGMSEEDCQQEELIGWLYQFYIADKKNDVFEALKRNIKITAKNIPAATQLFTPRWIVRYMVENTLGKLWLSLRPNSKLRDHMPYYIEAPEGNVPAPIPEDLLTNNNHQLATKLTFLDPCQGSGHVLVYAFDLFTKIYEEEGYNTNEIPALILEHNLFGIDIDERAAQLAAFSLTMKARKYYPRFLRKPFQSNVIALENVNEETIQQSVKLPMKINGKEIAEYKDLSLQLLTQADNFGSLIQIAPEEVKAIQIQEGSMWQEPQQKLKEQAEYLSRQYHCVVTNPPYMGQKNMNTELKLFVEKRFLESKTDLMACFIQRCLTLNFTNGKIAMINQHSWMFLSSYIDLRPKLIANVQFESMLHLGPRSFPEIGGEVVQNTAFVIGNYKPLNKGIFIRLTVFNNTQIKDEKTIEAIHNPNCGWFFIANQNEFEKIPGSPFGYWLTDGAIGAFGNKSISETGHSSPGVRTGRDNIFIRFWFELSFNKLKINSTDKSGLTSSVFTWYPITRGGEFRKWYGNLFNVIEAGNHFERIKDVCHDYRLRESEYYFKEGITWTMITNKPSFRIVPNGTLFGNGGPVLHIENHKYVLTFLNSKVCYNILQLLNPTMNITKSDIDKLPLIVSKKIEELATKNIEISKNDWDSHEISWNFQTNYLVEQNGYSLSDSFKKYILKCSTDIHELHKNEEKLNLQFIEIYGLQDELTPDVPLEEITILQEESKIVNGELFIDPVPVLLQLVSYSVGCIFGRYSLDKPGLIIANQGETLQDFLKEVPNPSFLPDEDNIIPILDGEWFNDDIVGRFKVFLKAAFGEEYFDENLKYLEETIGKDIRKYFVKDFYNDHIKRYKKRPIYWMFSSPKGHFKALIYMHRYQPDVCSKMLNDYLQAYISKLEAAKQTQTMLSLREDISAREKTLAIKETDKYEAMLKDCRDYAKTLFTIATQKINIDLDDGVKVNYQKFKEVLVPIKGLEKEEE
jgi:type II restriction/modification system DNA methylase subunit YeeA